MAEKLEFIIVARGDQASKVFKGLGDDLSDLRNKTEKEIGGASNAAKSGTTDITNSFRNLITAGVVLQAGRMLLDFGRDSINAASDVEESMSKARVVFGETFGEVQEELGNFSEVTGRSRNDLIAWAAGLQDTFVPLGFAREEAADFAVEITKLSTDLASFNNLNTADVVRDIQSALVGNTETVRKYGVVASQAFIEQEALNSGLWDGAGALDAQAKAQAIYQLILKGTTDAQGDAIRTADSYANQQVALESAVTDLKVAIGQGLIPAGQLYIDWAISAIRWTEDLVVAANKYRRSIEDQREEAVKAGLSWDQYVESLSDSERVLMQQNPRLYESTALLYQNNQLLYEAAQATDGWTVRLESNTPVLTDNTIAIEENAEAVIDLEEELSKIEFMLSDPLGKAYDDFIDKNADLEGEVADLKAGIEQLESKTYLTAEQKTQLEEMRTKLGETEGALVELALQHEDTTRRILFGMLQQELATDGWTTEELRLLGEVGARWGLLSSEAGETFEDFGEAMDGWREGDSYLQTVLALDQLANKAAGIAGTYDINYRVTYFEENTPPTGSNFGNTGDGNPQRYAHGADFIVPPGFENDTFGPMYASSGERVLVQTEAQQAINNNYNLTINTSAPTEPILDDFAMLQALAG